jgi:hypothetical protein
MARILILLRQEPAALGSLVASVLPALVLLGVLQVDEKSTAALVVAVNAIGAFAIRVSVTPKAKSPKS